MYCCVCKVMEIGPMIAPYGGYCCANKHIECEVCKTKFNGNCGICWKSVTFMLLDVHPLCNSEGHTSLKSTVTSHNLLKNSSESKTATPSWVSQEDNCHYSTEFLQHSVNKAIELIKQFDLYGDNSDNSKRRSRKAKHNATPTVSQNEGRENEFPFDDIPNCSNSVSVSEVRFMDPGDSKSQSTTDEYEREYDREDRGLARPKKRSVLRLQENLPTCCGHLKVDMIRDLEM